MKSIQLASILLLSLFDPGSNGPAAITSTELLINKKWIFGEIRFVENNQLEYYKKNGSENTISFEKDYLIFYKNNTGKYSNGITDYPISSWKFTGSKKLEYIIDKPEPLLVHWENISLSSGSISYSEYYTKEDGVSVMGIGIRKAVKP